MCCVLCSVLIAGYPSVLVCNVRYVAYIDGVSACRSISEQEMFLWFEHMWQCW